VAEPSELDMVSHVVAMGDEDVVVSGVAGAVVTVSVKGGVDEEEKVVLVRLPLLPVVNSKLSRVILGVVIRSRRICQEDSVRCSVR